MTPLDSPSFTRFFRFLLTLRVAGAKIELNVWKIGVWRCACGRKGRFFKEKAPQKPFWGKGFLVANGASANIGRPCLRGRAQYLPKAKTVSGLRFFGWAHLCLGGMMPECLEETSNWDLSVSKDRAPAWSPPKGGDHAQASPFKGRLPRLRGW